MARKKVTIDELRDSFEKARPYLSNGDVSASLLPMNGDDTKCVLTQGDKCQVFSCSALKGHLEFLLTAVVGDVDPP